MQKNPMYKGLVLGFIVVLERRYFFLWRSRRRLFFRLWRAIFARRFFFTEAIAKSP